MKAGISPDASASSHRHDGPWRDDEVVMLTGGFTHLQIRDDAGEAAQTFVPRDTVKFAATHQIPQWRDLKLGAIEEVTTPE